MASVTRRVTAEMAFKDAGFVAGMQQAGGAVGKFTTESALGVKAGGNLAATLGNAGRAFIGATLATAGLTGGVAALAVGLNTALREVGDMQMSMLKLKLAVGGNVQVFGELKAIVDASPRGLLFDDNDVARALAVAATLDTTNDEIRALLPSLRGMAAVMGQDLSEAVQNVSLALETGAVRSLRQYGISIEDVNAVSRKFYGAELKDLDEAAKRWSILNAVLDKSVLFQTGEQDALATLPGRIRAVRVEMGELMEEMVGPKAIAALDFFDRWTHGGGAFGKNDPFDALQRFFEKRVAKMHGPELPPIWGDVYGPVAPPETPGGIASDPAAAARAAALRARLLGNLTPDRGLVGSEFEGAGEANSASAKFARKQRDERLKVIREGWEMEAEAKEEVNELFLRMDEEHLAADLALWEANEAAKQEKIGVMSAAIVGGLYAPWERASQAFFSREAGRQKNLAIIVASGAKSTAGAVLKVLAQQELVLAAADVAAFISSGFTAAHKAAGALKHTAVAALAGGAGGALQSSAMADVTPTGGGYGGSELGGRSGRESATAQRGFGLTFTRPIENLTINVAVSISGTNFIGANQEGSIADMMEQYGIPAVRDAFDTGKIAA